MKCLYFQIIFVYITKPKIQIWLSSFKITTFYSKCIYHLDLFKLIFNEDIQWDSHYFMYNRILRRFNWNNIHTTNDWLNWLTKVLTNHERVAWVLLFVYRWYLIWLCTFLGGINVELLFQFRLIDCAHHVYGFRYNNDHVAIMELWVLEHWEYWCSQHSEQFVIVYVVQMCRIIPNILANTAFVTFYYLLLLSFIFIILPL